MKTLKEMEFTTLKELLQCFKAITKTVGEEYHDNNKVYLGISQSNILINPDDITNIKLIEQPSLTIGFDEVPKQCLKPWAPAEVQLFVNGNNSYYNRVIGNTAIDIGSIGNLLFYNIIGRIPEYGKDTRSFSRYDFSEDNRYFEHGIIDTIKNKLTELFHKTICINLKYIYSNYNDLINILDEIIKEL